MLDSDGIDGRTTWPPGKNLNLKYVDRPFPSIVSLSTLLTTLVFYCCHKFSALKVPSLWSYGSEVRSLIQSHWPKTKVYSGVCSFPEAPGGNVFLPFPASRGYSSYSLAYGLFRLQNQQWQVEPFLRSSPLTSLVIVSLFHF